MCTRLSRTVPLADAAGEFLDGRDEVWQPGVEHLADQLVLVGELLVQGALGDARGAGDLLGGGTGQPAGADQFGGGVQDPVAAAGHSLLLDSRVSAHPPTRGIDMPIDGAAAVRRLYDEVFNNGDLAVADELISPGFVSHGGPAGDVTGPEFIKTSARMLGGRVQWHALRRTGRVRGR